MDWTVVGFLLTPGRDGKPAASRTMACAAERDSTIETAKTQTGSRPTRAFRATASFCDCICEPVAQILNVAKIGPESLVRN
jgi:hypothetical protein